MHRFAPGDRGQNAGTPLVQRIMLAGLVSLALAIGLSAGAIAWRTASFDRTVPDLSTADPAIGYAFYAGIDQVLNGGSSEALEQVVSGDFVDHLDSGSDDRSADALIDELRAFGAAFPGTHLEAIDIKASSSSLVASIAPIGPRPVMVAGMTLSTLAVPAGYEVLRIRNGKVSERWAASLPQMAASTFAEASFSRASPSNIATRLDRISLPVTGSVVGSPGESAILIVESGSVRLGMDYVDADGNRQSVTVMLEAGGAPRLAPGGRIRIETDGDVPARLLLYSTYRVTAVEAPPLMFDGGATSELLWSSHLSLSDGGSWHFSIGRLDLPADFAAELATQKDTRLLLYSSDGSLQVLTEGGKVEMLDTRFVPSDDGSASSIAPGVAANISDTSHIWLRSDPDAAETVWLISIVSQGTATPVP